MLTAYVIVVAVALLLQIAFSALYWVFIPSWIKHPFGRLAQLGAWSLIIILSTSLWIILTGTSRDTGRAILTFGLLPMVGLGCLQLFLLKKAVGISDREEARDKNDD